jgi:hypothetical protein
LFIDEVLDLTSQIYPSFDTEKIFFCMMESSAGADYSIFADFGSKLLEI